MSLVSSQPVTDKSGSQLSSQLDDRFDGRIICVLILLFIVYTSNNVSEISKSSTATQPLSFTKISEELSLPVMLHSQATPLQPKVFTFEKIPINSADKDLLITIKGIGPVLAEKILSARREGLFFHGQEDLRKLPTIGIKRAEYLSSQVSFTTR